MDHQFESLVARSLEEGRVPDLNTATVETGTLPAKKRIPHRSRTRMISFRVSDEEFEILRVRSEAEGARNISEYARTALCERTKASDADLRRLSAEIQHLAADVARVTALIEHGTGQINAAPDDPPRE